MTGSAALRISLAIVLAGCVALPAPGAAQVATAGIQTVPPRDRVPMPTTGTGVIKGRVVDGASGAAVARARVRLMGGAGQRPNVLTDAGGTFLFKDLPRGTFMVAVEKSTYMLGRYPEAGRTLRASARPLILKDGESLDNLTVPIFRGGAIVGRVVDASGDPVEYAGVRLLRVSSSGGRPTMHTSAQTNDLGEFRLGKLEPGSYVITASGRRVSPDEMPLPGAEPSPQPVPTYYPGVTSFDLAQPIRIERGQTASDLEIALAESVPAIVSGTLVGEDAQPITTGGFINARATLKEMPIPFDMGGASVRPDGTFRMMLAPGDYVIEARAMTPAGSGSGSMSERFATVRLPVNGNVEGLSIVVGRGATASGRVIFEGTSAVPPNPQQMQFQLFAFDGMSCRQGRMLVAPDWTFSVEGLSGTCAAPPQAGMGAWILKSVQIDGEDLVDHTITFESGQRLRNVQVVFSDRRTEVTFNVADENGQATREYVGLVLPVGKGTPQPSAVRPYVPMPVELMNMAALNRPTSAPGLTPQGRRDSLGGMRAGEYYIIAIDDIGVDEVRDPAVLARLIAAATRVTLGDTPSTAVSLRRQKLADILKH